VSRSADLHNRKTAVTTKKDTMLNETTKTAIRNSLNNHDKDIQARREEICSLQARIARLNEENARSERIIKELTDDLKG
jgi:peptidoglycan hydrolase CwlO-like protein